MHHGTGGCWLRRILCDDAVGVHRLRRLVYSSCRGHRGVCGLLGRVRMRDDIRAGRLGGAVLFSETTRENSTNVKSSISEESVGGCLTGAGRVNMTCWWKSNPFPYASYKNCPVTHHATEVARHSASRNCADTSGLTRPV